MALPGFFSFRTVSFVLSQWSEPGLHSCVVSELGLGPLCSGSYTPGWGAAYSRSSEMTSYRYHLMTPCTGSFITWFASAGTLIAFLKTWKIKRLPHTHAPQCYWNQGTIADLHKLNIRTYTLKAWILVLHVISKTGPPTATAEMMCCVTRSLSALNIKGV